MQVHSSNDERITLNPQTGVILGRYAEKSVGSHIQHAQVDFVSTGRGIQAVDLQTGEILWQRIGSRHKFYHMAQWPSFVDDDIIFQIGQPCYVIARVTVRTGQAVWQKQEGNYLSNFAISGSRLYALREDLMLMAFDVETGAVIGNLQFEGPPAATIYARSGGDVYWLTTEGSYLLVYFSDTHELIAFKQVTP